MPGSSEPTHCPETVGATDTPCQHTSADPSCSACPATQKCPGVSPWPTLWPAVWPVPDISRLPLSAHGALQGALAQLGARDQGCCTLRDTVWPGHLQGPSQGDKSAGVPRRSPSFSLFPRASTCGLAPMCLPCEMPHLSALILSGCTLRHPSGRRWGSREDPPIRQGLGGPEACGRSDPEVPWGQK